MENNKEVVVLKSRVSKLETQANTIIIESQDDYKAAIDIVSRLKETGSAIKAEKEKITKPANAILKETRSKYKPIEDQFKAAEMIVKTKLLDYNRKVNEAASKREAKIAKSLEDGNIKLETAEKKMDKVERVESTTHGDVGQVQVRKVRKVRITDKSKLPREYLTPDMVSIRRDALGGKSIPGVEVYEEESIAAR